MSSIDPRPNKSLGQHWLHDAQMLTAIVDAARVGSVDTVLEIGPGLGTLTRVLVDRAEHVVAVEFDEQLARELPHRVRSDRLRVVQSDILAFDLSTLPANYKVVANVPYYITSKIVQLLAESPCPPSRCVLLVQKEVAERLAATPGDLSILGISAQLYFDVRLDVEVPARYFTPPPKVDSQVVVMERRQAWPYVDIAARDYFRVVKAGFSEKRKMLRSSLSGGLQMAKSDINAMLVEAGVSPEARAQELSLDQWAAIARVWLART